MLNPNHDTDSDTDSDATPINALSISQQLNNFESQLSSINITINQFIQNGQYDMLPNLFPTITYYKDGINNLRDSSTITGEEKTKAINLIKRYIFLRDKIDNVLRENRLGVDGMPLRGGKLFRSRKSYKRRKSGKRKRKSIRKKSIRKK
jgi:hypothetical protein